MKVSQERPTASTRAAEGTGEQTVDPTTVTRAPALRTLVLVVVAALSGALAGAVVAHDRSKAATPSTSLPPSASSTVAGALAAVGPAVVSIRTEPVDISQIEQPRATPGSATGVVIRSDGVILTSAGVVASGRPISVRLADGRALRATVLGRDLATDLALLKVSAHALPIARLTTSDALGVGDDVVALGDALSLPGGPTVGRGVVAALHRTIALPASDVATGLPSRLSGLIQVTEPLGAGDAGGPVVDAHGAVVGVATAADGEQAPGFAVDVYRAGDAIRALEQGRATADRLGVEAIDVTPALANAYGLPVQSGAFVAAVVPHSPAATAGVRSGDIVVQADRERVATAEDLSREAREPSNTTLPLKVVRGTRRLVVTVKLPSSG
ncbi:MAG TPA: trypsin-like peptidase domain-containing protein [Acidimicrobiia bacterium]|nr:trypsin-like peptidase domain-containing protein [Acidimicrobiia bacterium]